MSKLPTQLTWARFKCILKRLGYVPFSSGGGSARTFFKDGGDPDLVTFHEPHGSDDRETFLEHLEEC